jgi:hypothetical protein
MQLVDCPLIAGPHGTARIIPWLEGFAHHIEINMGIRNCRFGSYSGCFNDREFPAVVAL